MIFVLLFTIVIEPVLATIGLIVIIRAIVDERSNAREQRRRLQGGSQ